MTRPNLRLASRWLGLSGAALGLAGLLAGLSSAAAQTGAEAGATHSVGAWDLKLEDGSRECRINLRSDPLGPGYQVAMPVGCRKAFPVLGSVAIWNDGAEGKVQFSDRSGQPILNFEAGAGGALTGTSPAGEVYRLQPIGQHRAIVLKPAKTDGAGAKSAKSAGPRLPLPSIAEMAGHYAVLRKAKDTGCMVTFDATAHGPKGSLKANLAPACRDQGIVIFDPVGWQMQGGRLVLTARKGHTTKLDLQEDGSWMKDASEGKSLSLKKM